MKKIERVILIGLVLAALPMCAWAADYTWDGGGDKTNWFDASNWNPNVVPTDGDTAVVQGGSYTNILLTNSIR